MTPTGLLEEPRRAQRSAAVAAPAPDAAAHVADLLVLYGDEIDEAARRFTRNGADAEDLAQDVRLRALGFAAHFERGSNFPAWIRTMTRNLAINRTRAAALRPVPAASLASEGVLEAAPAREPSPAPADLRSLLGCREDLSGPVLAAVERLPERYRQVLLLWAVGECEYREIARIAGCPVGTVMSRLHRARRLMRRYLATAVDARGVVTR